ncbi:T9SS type A sorting domain-containing protein [Paraflavitalea sp. CAU 1676]|nr:T9SS type A sorting domain-containing protein [Paraflavitalea sp. CAU 1676]
MATGTPQVMPNPANGAAILLAPATLSGPYRGAPAQNRIQFVINDNAGENFYFNVKAYDRTTPTANQVQVYYRILNSSNVQVVAPTPIATGAQISTYAQAVAGPNIAGTVPTGYAPITFDPAVNDTYYIEIYYSTDAGATANTQQTLLTLFDFTVATPAGVRRLGRIYSRGWSFITYNPTGNQGSINNAFEGDFYGYTNDSTVVKLDFLDFRPFGFTLYMNHYGAVNGTNWLLDRRSQNTGASAPSLPNGYPVFLAQPDATIFPTSTPATAPQFAGKIYGCAPNIYIPFRIDKPGDVVILLDLNGTAGYQAGTADRYLYFIDRPVGYNVGVWDGLNGLGAAVAGNVTINMTLSSRRGRVNIPLYDAELNPQGFNVSGVAPLATVPRLYFDDALLANTSPSTCVDATGDANNNNTGTGITNADVGLVPPARAWNGPGSGNAVPAPAAGGASTAITCDDFGNVRTLNTWFWAYEISSSIFVLAMPTCSGDGDAIPYTTDVDDDNDGVTDIVEGGGTDPFADADADGTPNLLDLTPGGTVPAFVDANSDGVNDNYDADLDGIVNSFDLDSDNDGIPDLIENGGVDTNGNGRVDGTADVDADGLIDTYDASQGGVILAPKNPDGDLVPNARDLDSDNDGIPDIVEAGGIDANNDGVVDTFVDSDGDGWANAYDPDDDNNGTNENPEQSLIITGADANADGLADSYTRGDFDADGKANPYDLDADGDGILDVREAGLPDADNNGIVDGTTGADGWSDTVDALISLALTNTDGLTNPNYLDIDSDNDGIVDNIEAQTTTPYIAPVAGDTDGDGISNAYDNLPAAFGGNSSNGLTPTNTDGADNPDYTDLDSDNDNKTDAIEGWDTNGNGVINGAEKTGGAADIDNDGLLDGYDANTAAVNPTNGTAPTSYPDVNNPGGDRDWRQAQNSDNDAIPDNVDIDDDNDGVPDTAESATGLDPLADQDSDGILNYLDPSQGGFNDSNGDGVDDQYDADLDGVINSRDLDSDNDGIPDIIEAGGIDTDGNGRVDVTTDTNGNGLMNPYDPANGGTTLANLDTDGDTIPNSLDLDSDNDGLPDIVEAGGADANNDGKVDGFTDADGDGYADAYDPDDNNDGTNEGAAQPLIVTSVDTNGDGKADSYTSGDYEGDGKANPYDLDTDGDGILDVREAGLPDTDNNGIVDGTLGADGWSDSVDALPSLSLIDTDSTGNPDFADIDADNDGIVDNIEGQPTSPYIAPAGADTDGDGIDNAYDNAPGAFGGTANNGITPTNTDGIDLADYRDLDADNDGKSDALEGWDTNGNGTIDGAEKTGGATDADGDGLLDGYDNNTAAVNPTNGTTPTSYPDVNNPGGNRDWRQAVDRDNDGVTDLVDVDDDNDGVPDTDESPVGLNPMADADSDGIPNYLDSSNGGYVDTNGDGIDDRYDTDLDGVINAFDLDSDNDGIADLVEAGGVDTNGDGRVDGAFADADGDGLATAYDANNGGVALSNFDSDGDLIPNALDTDSDNDGIPDVREAGGTDANNDGYIDGFADADGDGFSDAVDGDAGNDGTAENTAGALIITGTDTNGDGIPNSYPKANADANGLPNPYDLDADGDGIPDVEEAGITHNIGEAIATGTLNAKGWSSTVDALPTLTLPNTDTDIYPNYLDIDADNDGITDNVEGQLTNQYKLPTGTDTDGDGIDNEYDKDNNILFNYQGLIPVNFLGAVDVLPDYIDPDTDDDGVSDIIEGHDADLNQVADYTLTGIDTDGDGLDNAFDLDNTGPNVKNEGMNAVPMFGFDNPPANPPAPLGARGPLQENQAVDLDRSWRTINPALPITLVNFKAQKQGDSKVYLSWRAESQSNFKEFILERSTDGVRFSAVATIEGKEGLSADYSYLDDIGAQAASRLYYRLKQVDNDGRFEYSRILNVILNIAGITIRVAPNPARDYVTINITADRKLPVAIHVVDNLGRLLIIQRTSVDKGDNIIRLNNTNTLQNGNYNVVVTAGDNRSTQKLMIQK